MWHVDEGILNAYLDGELGGQLPGHPDAQEVETHLAQCADCRALLNEVERVRDRASNILASSGPSALDMPPFEELRSRKEARSQQRHVRQLNRSKVLAWAATIVLAAGVGWFARDAILTRDASQLEVPSLREPLALEPSTERAQDAFDQERDTVSPTDIARGVGGRAVQPVPTSRPLGDAALRQTIAQVPAENEAREKALAEDFLASAAQKQEVNRAEPEAEEQIVSPAAADANVTIVRQVDSVRRARESAPELRAQLADTDRVNRPSPETAEAVAPVANRVIRDDRADVTSAWDTLAWDTVTADVAREQWDGPPPQVEGLPVTTYAIAKVDGETVTRVTQLLDEGTAVPIDVIAYRPTEPAARVQVRLRGAAAGFASGGVTSGDTSEVTEKRSDYTVVLRGSVPVDSLTVLLRRVVPD